MKARTGRDVIRKQIFERFCLQPKNFSTKSDLYAGDIERITHGVMHASRTEAVTVILRNMLREIIRDFDLHVTAIDKVCSRVAALMHDSARRGEGKDVFEFESEENCQNFLESIGLSPHRAYFYASLITTKESNLVPPDWIESSRIKYLRMLMQSADALDIMRCKKEFDLEKLSCWKYFARAGQESKLIKLAINLLDIIAAQQDLMYDCKIMLEDKCIYQRRATMADKYVKALDQAPRIKKPQRAVATVDLKKQYEHNVDCREKIIADFKKNAFLRQYTAGMDEDLAELNYAETPLQQKRKSIRASAKKVEIKDDFVIKGLRNGLHSLEFFDGVLPPHTHHPIRSGQKGKYIADGSGVHLRSKKKPLYTPEQKKDYSKAQPVTLGTAQYHPPVFNFGGNEHKLIGAMFLDKKDFLLTDTLSLTDYGSVARTNEFDEKFAAENFFAVHNLFPSEALPEFKAKIESKEYQKLNTFNECKTHLHWSPDGKCQIFICNDNFDTRILAQVQAKIIKQRLLAKKACSEDYEVSICFYQPDNESLHLVEYSPEEQKLDIEIAHDIASSDQFRRFKYAADSFEFLLVLDKEIFSKLNSAPVYSQDIFVDLPLLVYMLKTENTHFYDYLIEFGLIDKNEFAKIIDNAFKILNRDLPLLKSRNKNDVMRVLKIVNDKIAEILLIMNAAIAKNNQNLFDVIFNKLVEYYDIAAILFASGAMKRGFLMGAIQQFKNSHYLICLLSLLEKCQLDLNFTDKMGETLLHYAACDRTGNYLRICLSVGCVKHINTVDEKGRTPLHIAISSGNKDAVEALLSTPGIKPGIPDNEGNSIIDTAIASNNIEMLLLLLKHFKLDPSSSLNNKGQNILQLCLKHHAFRILNYYLNIDKTININLQDAKGDTCLHYLVSISKKIPNELMLVYLGVLFQLGIKPYIKNNEGKTAYKLALAQKNPNIAAAVLAGQYSFIAKRMVPLLDEIQKNKELITTEREWSLLRLSEQMKTIDELFQVGFNPKDLLNKVNAGLDNILEIDKLAKDHATDLASNKKIQDLFENAYSMALSEDVNLVKKIRRSIELTMQEQQTQMSKAETPNPASAGSPSGIQKTQAEGRRRFSTFKEPQQVGGKQQTVATQSSQPEILHRQRIPKQ